jgi:hypothetical protein
MALKNEITQLRNAQEQAAHSIAILRSAEQEFPRSGINPMKTRTRVDLPALITTGCPFQRTTNSSERGLTRRTLPTK